MAESQIHEQLIRRTRLPQRLARPVFTTDMRTGAVDEAVPNWAGVSTAVVGPSESYHLYLCLDDGRILAYFQYETIEIALDQAWDITGVDSGLWESCSIDLSLDGAFAWPQHQTIADTRSE